MRMINTSPISGMQELLPNLQAKFNQLKSDIAEVFHQHGFQNIETPIIDRSEILLAKAGGDTEKQIYKVIKTTEAADGADQALRFDHTVPLARYTVEHSHALTFPFKVSQIGRNFRGERAQKGRFREFYQCDVDIIGWQHLPVAYDAEVILTLAEALSHFPLPRLQIRLSNRKILNGLLDGLGLDNFDSEIFNIVDHAEKIPPAKTKEHLEALEISADKVAKLLEFIKISGPIEEVIPSLEALGIANEKFQQGLTELEAVQNLVVARLEQQKQDNIEVIADMVIVRGLDYYTGTVFETIAPDYRAIGSICSGGRYENLASHYTDHLLPGVGGSIGLTRLFYILNEYQLIDTALLRPIEYCIIPISSNEIAPSEAIATQLRTAGHSADVILFEKRLSDKLNYAGRTARYAIIVGSQEVESGNYMVKDLITGSISPLDLE